MTQEAISPYKAQWCNFFLSVLAKLLILVSSWHGPTYLASIVSVRSWASAPLYSNYLHSLPAFWVSSTIDSGAMSRAGALKPQPIPAHFIFLPLFYILARTLHKSFQQQIKANTEPKAHSYIRIHIQSPNQTINSTIWWIFHTGEYPIVDVLMVNSTLTLVVQRYWYSYTCCTEELLPNKPAIAMAIVSQSLLPPCRIDGNINSQTKEIGPNPWAPATNPNNQPERQT